MRRCTGAMNVGLHLQGTAHQIWLSCRREQGLRCQSRRFQPQRHRLGRLRGVRGQSSIEVAFRQIGGERIQPELSAAQVDMCRDGAIGRTSRLQLGHVQFHIGIRQPQQAEWDRGVRNHVAIGRRLGRRRS